MKILGIIFFSVRDSRIYASTLGGEVRHYRDNAGLESDVVIHLEDGRWGAVEIKLGGDDLIEAGAARKRTILCISRRLVMIHQIKVTGTRDCLQ